MKENPPEIYAIGLVDGIATVKAVQNKDYIDEAVWDTKAVIGEAIECAIEFDGKFHVTENKYIFETFNEPWLFWVTPTNTLYAQHYTDESTRIVLAENVLKITAIRGYRNTEHIDNDQGLVAMYIKSDKLVYYRSYCLYKDVDTRIWENERSVAEFVGEAVSLTSFRTNDYRVGFNIEDINGTTTTLITTRNWVGLASPQEYLSVGIKDITINVIPIKYYDEYSNEKIDVGISDIWFNVAEPIYPIPISAKNPDKSIYQIVLKFSHKIADDIDLSTVKNAFTIKDSLNTNFAILSTQAGADYSEIIFTCAVFGGASGNMFIAYDRTVLELDCLNQGSRFAIESFNYEFKPDLVPPEGHALEYLQVGIKPTFTVTQVNYRNGYANTDNISIGIIPTIIVTKVGSNPL